MIDLKVPEPIKNQVGITDTKLDIVLGKVLSPNSEFLRGLNNSQLEATHLIRQNLGTNPGLFFIHDAPSTGKTTTIVKLILSLLNDGIKIWIAAPSNNAVEVILLKLLEESTSVQQQRFLRITTQIGPNPKVADFLLSKRIIEKEIRDSKTDQHAKKINS
ncbi:hypothetical protein GEMRC1_002763 [Eukaryota sp. GEM-RC1]